MKKIAMAKRPAAKAASEKKPISMKSFRELQKVKLAVVEPTPHTDLPVDTFPGAQNWLHAQLQRAKDEGIFTIKAVLTNAIARLLLDSNDSNRRIIESHVKKMAQEMVDGTFDWMNGQTIQVSICGQLNDAQHRLHAKLVSEAPDPMVQFMFGVAREARLTIDQGRSRRSGDYLAMTGHEGGQYAASVASILWQWREKGTIKRSSANHLGLSAGADYARKHYEQIKASLQVVPRRGAHSAGGLPLLAFCHLLLAEKNFTLATDFIDRLVNGYDLAAKSPIAVARQRIITNKRLRREEKMELIIRAWNAWREGREVSALPVHDRIPDIVA